MCKVVHTFTPRPLQHEGVQPTLLRQLLQPYGRSSAALSGFCTVWLRLDTAAGRFKGVLGYAFVVFFLGFSAGEAEEEGDSDLGFVSGVRISGFADGHC